MDSEVGWIVVIEIDRVDVWGIDEKVWMVEV